MTGYTNSSDFPTTAGVYDTSFNDVYDVFVSKFSSDGDALLWSTFLGGSSDEGSSSVILDASGCPVVTGCTSSSDFPTTGAAYDALFNGGVRDVFVSKLSSTGSALLWSTFLGGSSDDYGQSLQLDASGNPLVTGYTYSANFPTTAGAYDSSPNGSCDAFVVNLSVQDPTIVGTTGLRLGAVLLSSEPNPIPGRADIRYTLGQEAQVTLLVYDIAGRVLIERRVGIQGAGAHSIEWDGRDDQGRRIAPGAYFARLQAGENGAVRKVVLLR